MSELATSFMILKHESFKIGTSTPPPPKKKKTLFLFFFLSCKEFDSYISNSLTDLLSPHLIVSS